MKLHYKSLVVIAALLAAPIAFADENTGTPPPPHQNPEPSFFGRGYGHPGPGDEGHRPADASTTPERRPPPPPHMMASSTPHERDLENGTSTPPRPGPGAGFFSHILNFLSGKPGNGSPTPPPPGDESTNASTTVEASTTPPPTVVQFLQGFFGRFFH